MFNIVSLRLHASSRRNLICENLICENRRVRYKTGEGIKRAWAHTWNLYTRRFIRTKQRLLNRIHVLHFQYNFGPLLKKNSRSTTGRF